jgi:hypothetical protein
VAAEFVPVRQKAEALPGLLRRRQEALRRDWATRAAG